MVENEYLIESINEDFKRAEKSMEKYRSCEPKSLTINEALEMAEALHVSAFDCLACDIEMMAGQFLELLGQGKRALEAGDHMTYYFGDVTGKENNSEEEK